MSLCSPFFVSRCLCSAAVVFALPATVSAATLGPDAFGYMLDDAPNLSRVDILTGADSVLPNSDDGSQEVELGFDFDFYGVTYDSVFVNNNGLLTFGSGSSQFTNINLTVDGPSGNQPAIAPLWDDWVTNRNDFDQVLVDTLPDPAGGSQFVVEWFVNEGFSSSPSPVTFQTVLHELDNSIDFQYDDTVTGDFRTNGGQATIGIRDTDGQSNGRVLQFSFNEPVLADTGSSLRFTVVPEPGSLALLSLGAVALVRRRRG